MATFSSTRKSKPLKTTRRRISRWRDIWVLPLMLIISVSPAIYVFLTTGRLAIWTLVPIVFGFALAGTGLYIRFGYWPDEEIYESEDGRRIYLGGKLIFWIIEKPPQPETLARHRHYCQERIRLKAENAGKYPEFTDYEIALELGIERSTLMLAHRYWATGYLDNRGLVDRLKDDLRVMRGERRYLPPD
jgi:hypothetical protein